MSEALGKNIVHGSDMGFFDDRVEFLLDNGEKLQLTSDEILQILATSKKASEIEGQLLKENIAIYERFGATYNEELNQFEDSTHTAITSLDQLAGVTEEQAKIMSKFANDTNYKDFMTKLYGGTDQFADLIASGNYALDGTKFEDREAALDQFLNNESFQEQVKQYSEQYSYPIETVEQFADALNRGIINVDGLSEAIKELTPEAVDLTKNINGNEFTNRIDIASDEDKLKGILEDANVGEGAFNRMARDSYEDETGYYQQEKEHLESLIAAKEEDGTVTSEEREEIAGLNSEIQNLNESAKDTTAMMINTADGVVDLRNKIGDISEVLSDEGAKGTVE